jgi:hypothetical protein
MDGAMRPVTGWTSASAARLSAGRDGGVDFVDFFDFFEFADLMRS